MPTWKILLCFLLQIKLSSLWKQYIKVNGSLYWWTFPHHPRMLCNKPVEIGIVADACFFIWYLFSLGCYIYNREPRIHRMSLLWYFILWKWNDAKFRPSPKNTARAKFCQSWLGWTLTPPYRHNFKKFIRATPTL